MTSLVWENTQFAIVQFLCLSFLACFPTCFHAKMCLLGVALILLPIVAKLPTKPYFGGMNRYFPGKHTKYSNFRISKSTQWIRTKFSQIIKSSKYSYSMVPNASHKCMMADVLKIEKLPYVRKCLTDFDEIWHNNTSGPYISERALKIYDFENPRWQTDASLKNRTITISRQPFDWFWLNLARWCIWDSHRQLAIIFLIRRSKLAAAAILKN